MSGTKVRRVFVISDLHLGGQPPTMMSTPDRLAAFIESLPSRLQSDEQLELVINGDFVDFLAIEPCLPTVDLRSTDSIRRWRR